MKSIGRLTKKIDNQEFDITYDCDNIFYIPGGKKEKLNMLKRFVIRECYSSWSREDRKLSTMKKQFLSEILNSLS